MPRSMANDPGPNTTMVAAASDQSVGLVDLLGEQTGRYWVWFHLEQKKNPKNGVELATETHPCLSVEMPPCLLVQDI
jgi:hypothetical protein